MKQKQITIDDEIKELERELSMRLSVYPKLQGQGKQKKSDGDLYIACMQKTLDRLKLIRAEITGTQTDLFA